MPNIALLTVRQRWRWRHLLLALGITYSLHHVYAGFALYQHQQATYHPTQTDRHWVVDITPLFDQNLATRRCGLTTIEGVFLFLSSCGLWFVLRQREQQQMRSQRQRLLASLGQMSAVISHELRNPLTAAIGQAELLYELLDNDTRQQRARRVISELERIETLANHLLAFINASRVRPMKLNVLKWAKQLAAQYNTNRLSWHMGELSAPFVLDPMAMDHAMAHLLDNALHVSAPDDTVEVHVETRQGALTISVLDRGPGLPQQINIFEPFVTTNEQGTGLGLAIVQEIIHAHQGQITAQDRDGGGALFLITIPPQERQDEH